MRNEAALAVVIEGVAAAAWFGWAGSDASSALAVVLVVGAVVGLLCAVGGLIQARRPAPDGTVVRTDGTARSGIETARAWAGLGPHATASPAPLSRTAVPMPTTSTG